MFSGAFWLSGSHALLQPTIQIAVIRGGLIANGQRRTLSQVYLENPLKTQASFINVMSYTKI